MSLPLTRDDITRRCNRLARIIADDLADRQTRDGNFPLPEFYAKGFACALWTELDAHRYKKNINRAFDALIAEVPDRTYHREFIEYALLAIPGLSKETRNSILKNACNLAPDVANWQILGLGNHQAKSSSFFNKLLGLLHTGFIRYRYWRSPVFLDRPGCFSAQYHAFCAALLSDSPTPSDRVIASKATGLIAALVGDHGYANLLGRGAGQSFGAVCALYVLMKHGFYPQAEAVLYRLEEAILNAGSMPLNLLAAMPLPENPGPASPQTPGWYSYNRHDDYLAFAGYWLHRAAILKPADSPAGQSIQSQLIFLKTSQSYHVQMALVGKQSFDVSSSPVIIAGHGQDAILLLPPTGGETDQKSLYAPTSIPLPMASDGQVGLFQKAQRVSETEVRIQFSLAGKQGSRTLTFTDDEICITDRCPDPVSGKPDLFRLLFNGELGLARISDHKLFVERLGVRIHCDHPISIDQNDTYTAAGPAQRITAPGCNHAKLSIRWETRHV